jgi:hypothetical protein
MSSSQSFRTQSNLRTWRRASLLFCRPPMAMKREVPNLARQCIGRCTVNHNSWSQHTVTVGRSILTAFTPSSRLLASSGSSPNLHHREPPS